jgi:hypothetical protein
MLSLSFLHVVVYSVRVLSNLTSSRRVRKGIIDVSFINKTFVIQIVKSKSNKQSLCRSKGYLFDITFSHRFIFGDRYSFSQYEFRD